jgi:RhoGAP domain
VLVDDDDDEGPKISALSELVSRLPTLNRNLMAAICTSSAQVAVHKEKNKMDLGNLAIIYGPSILISRNPNAATMITDMESINNVCKSMFGMWPWTVFALSLSFSLPHISHLSRALSNSLCAYLRPRKRILDSSPSLLPFCFFFFLLDSSFRQLP